MRRALAGMTLFVLALVGVSEGTALAQDEALARGLRGLTLKVPQDTHQRTYLGISPEAEVFRLADIPARIVIVELFSMYCPHCQKHAPRVNELYTLIKARDELRDTVRVIGIGVGNSPYEVEIFRRKYTVAFPLFDDKDYHVYNTFKGIVTPYFLGIVRNATGERALFYARPGGFTDAREFLDLMLDLAQKVGGG